MSEANVEIIRRHYERDAEEFRGGDVRAFLEIAGARYVPPSGLDRTRTPTSGSSARPLCDALREKQQRAGPKTAQLRRRRSLVR